jgi:mono/diheme cytochrome c family protein
MKKILFLNMLIIMLSGLCLGFAPGNGKTEQPSLTASIKRGETVFMQNCLACHQANGAGVPNLNPPLIQTKYVLGEKKELITILLHGLTGEIQIGDDTYNGTMPPHNFLSDQQIADVLTYVRNSFGNKASLVKPAEVKAVRSKLKV